METILIFQLRGPGWSANAEAVRQTALDNDFSYERDLTPGGAIIKVRCGSHMSGAAAAFKLSCDVGATSVHHLGRAD